MKKLNMKNKAIYVVIPVLLAACKQKPLDPAVQAKIDKVEAQKKSAVDSLKIAQDSASFYSNSSEEMRANAAKMYANAREADRAVVLAKYNLNKVFKPEQVAVIKKSVELRGRSSFIATSYDNVMSGKGSLMDVVKVMSEISNPEKVAKMENLTKGILGFDKDEDGFFAVFVDPKIHAMVEKEAEELNQLVESEFEAPAMKKIEKSYKNARAEAVKRDSIAQRYAKLADAYSSRKDSLDMVLRDIKKRQK